jgi:hypothetical protein
MNVLMVVLVILSLLVAVVGFACRDARPSWRAVALTTLSAMLLTMALYFVVLFAAHDFNPDAILIDACLDDGGRWEYEERSCDTAPSTSVTP